MSVLDENHEHTHCLPPEMSELLHERHELAFVDSVSDLLLQQCWVSTNQIVISNVTEFWKITLMGTPETIRIFEFTTIC